MERHARIALLIDADNAPANKLDLILNELSSLGETHDRRAYGNWEKESLRPWKDVLHARAIRPVQQYDVSKGKNASDIALAVEAMEILHRDHPDAFGIVSSDADFTPLVMHLRARGAAVYGFGEAKTPEPFRSACSRFLLLETLVAEDPEVEEAASSSRIRISPNSLKGDAGLITLLRNAIASAKDDSGWARVGAVGSVISNQSSFDARNYGYATLSKLFKAIDLFELKDEGKPHVSVRDARASRRNPDKA